MRNEKGNITITTIGIIFAFIFMIAILMDFFSIFILKRQAQTVADATCLAAVQTLEKEFINGLELRVTEVLNQFVSSVDDDVNEILENAGDDAVINVTELTRDIIHSRVGESQLTNAIHAYKLNPSNKPSTIALTKNTYFRQEGNGFSPKQNGNLLYQIALSKQGLIGSKAGNIATENKGELEQIYMLVGESPKVQVKVKKEIGLPLISKIFNFNPDVPDMEVWAAAVFRSPDVVIDLTGKEQIQVDK